MSTRLVPSSSWAERARASRVWVTGAYPQLLCLLGLVLAAVTVYLLWPLWTWAFVGAGLVVVGVAAEWERGLDARGGRRGPDR